MPLSRTFMYSRINTSIRITSILKSQEGLILLYIKAFNLFDLYTGDQPNSLFFSRFYPFLFKSKPFSAISIYSSYHKNTSSLSPSLYAMGIFFRYASPAIRCFQDSNFDADCHKIGLPNSISYFRKISFEFQTVFR